jgi:hypothetical protein
MRDQQDDKLQLGKGRSYFVKSQLKRLRQEDDIWEADFFPVPQQGFWIGLVISHTDDFVLAHRTIEEPPTVNDLAQLLAEAMRRPLVEFSHRPRTIYVRERPEWAELVPHLKQVGIEVMYQDKLPKWDDAFGDLYAQVEENGPTGKKKGRQKSRKEPPMARKSSSPVKLHKPAEKGNVQLYTLEVFLMSGPISEKFAKKNPVISRTIQIRGDQTLEDLHHAIFDAFGRWEEHMYEFQFGKGPMDLKAPGYVLPNADDMDDGKRPAGRVEQTTIGSLGLEVGRSFGYWFDFGDDWWHQIDVTAIEEKVSAGKYPKVTKKVGKSPPQYPDE